MGCRSFVSYAVHKNLYPVLNAYAHASFDNLTMYKGLLAETLRDYKGPADKLGYVITPQDIYIPSTVEVIHYLTPGLMTQLDKPLQVPTTYPPTPSGPACHHTPLTRSAV